MALISFRCSNFNNCSKADEQQDFRYEEGTNPSCPECLQELRPVLNQRRRLPIGWTIVSIAVASSISLCFLYRCGAEYRRPYPVPPRTQFRFVDKYAEFERGEIRNIVIKCLRPPEEDVKLLYTIEESGAHRPDDFELPDGEIQVSKNDVSDKRITVVTKAEAKGDNDKHFGIKLSLLRQNVTPIEQDVAVLTIVKNYPSINFSEDSVLIPSAGKSAPLQVITQGFSIDKGDFEVVASFNSKENRTVATNKSFKIECPVISKTTDRRELPIDYEKFVEIARSNHASTVVLELRNASANLMIGKHNKCTIYLPQAPILVLDCDPSVAEGLVPDLVIGYLQASSATISAINHDETHKESRIEGLLGSLPYCVCIRSANMDEAFKSLEHRDSDIVVSSRDFDQGEIVRLFPMSQSSLFRPEAHPIAIDPLLILVSTENAMKSISIEQFIKLATGERTWNQIDPRLAVKAKGTSSIKVYTRKGDVGLYPYLRTKFGASVQPFPKEFRMEDGKALLNAVRRDPDAIGFVEESQIFPEETDAPLKPEARQIPGIRKLPLRTKSFYAPEREVAPKANEVWSGQYALGKILTFYTHFSENRSFNVGNEHVEKFIAYVSHHGQADTSKGLVWLTRDTRPLVEFLSTSRRQLEDRREYVKLNIVPLFLWNESTAAALNQSPANLDLPPVAEVQLSEFASSLLAELGRAGGYKLRIEGFADDVGGDNGVSQGRADFAKSMFIQKCHELKWDISAESITAVGKGIIPCTETGDVAREHERKLNRKVELWLSLPNQQR